MTFGWTESAGIYEFQDKELRGFVKPIAAHSACYVWVVAECTPTSPYRELIVGDTVGDHAMELAQNAAMIAICEIRLGNMRRLCLRCLSEEWVPSKRGSADVHVMNCTKCPNPEMY